MQGMQTTAPEAGSTTSPVPAQHSEQDRIRSGAGTAGAVTVAGRPAKNLLD